jgi:hypothetical protein
MLHPLRWHQRGGIAAARMHVPTSAQLQGPMRASSLSFFLCALIFTCQKLWCNHSHSVPFAAAVANLAALSEGIASKSKFASSLLSSSVELYLFYTSFLSRKMRWTSFESLSNFAVCFFILV